MNSFKKIFSLFSKSEKRRFVLVLSMVAVMGLLETATVASIMPFLSVLGNPEAIETNVWLNKVYVFMGFSDSDSFLFFLGIVVLFFLVAGNAFKSLTTWAKFRFVQMRGYSLSKKMLNIYLSRPYSFYLNRNSSDLTKNVLSEVDNVIAGIMVPGMEMVTNIIVVLFLSALLFFIDPLLVLVVVSILSLSYLAIYKFIRHELNVKGSHRVRANKERYALVGEIFGGIKDVKLMGLEAGFLQRFSIPARDYALKQTYQNVASKVPKYFMEAVAFGGIIIIALYLLTRMSSLDSIIPVLGMFAFAGYKLLPALQQIFAALTKLRFSVPALDLVQHELRVKNDEFNSILSTASEHQGVSLKDSINMYNIHFSYPGADAKVVNALSLEIKAGTTVGLVGSTGSGKTTLVDIILGLLMVSEGEFYVDNLSINRSNVRLWQERLGYVPQNIYLADDTIAANIAFGQKPSEIDMKKVAASAKMAKVHNFILNGLSHGYETVVGERGIRLSGGQRQRIGIARALYRSPEVLVLDEATSALDNITERSVMAAIRNIKYDKTTIIIAHRLSTVEHCDIIHILERGRIKASGTYEELLQKDSGFQMLVNDGDNINTSINIAL